MNLKCVRRKIKKTHQNCLNRNFEVFYESFIRIEVEIENNIKL